MKNFLNVLSLLLLFGMANLCCVATDLEDESVPKNYLCPISYSIFTNPVSAADGHTYERESIENWFRECRNRGLPLTSPMTGARLADSTLRDNFTLKSIISDWKEKKSNELAQQISVLSPTGFLSTKKKPTCLESSKKACKTISSWIPFLN